jgi:hypothetical protein
VSSPTKPIFSRLEDDPDLQDAINQFVVTLAERIDLLQDVHSAGDFGRLGDLCSEIADDAERLGYPILGSVARMAVDACLESKAEASEEGLVEMNELTQRIREAHRGAA